MLQQTSLVIFTVVCALAAAQTCKSTEYCCPDAKACLTPTKVSCDPSAKSGCASGQVCCPLTKICVIPGKACVSPCADKGTFCCPDAKACLTPANAGAFCTGPGSQGSCAVGQICCPLINQCVTVGAKCDPTPPGPAPGPGPSPGGKTIVELAASVADLSTLVTALKAGNLTDALSGKGPFTVFAPTNEAFAKLPSEFLKHLLEPQNIKQLDSILEYHVLSADVHAKDLKPEQQVKTLEGEELFIQKSFVGVLINGHTRVTKADVDASNGVVHIIDGVLVPRHINVE